MKLRIPPPLVFLITAGIMWCISYFLEIGTYAVPFRRPIFYLLTLCAMAITFLAIYGFKSVKTTVDPLKPEKASQLVTEGIYTLSRNPMYLALLILLTAWAIFLNSPLSLLVIIFFVWFLTEFQIKPEEEALTEKFGEAYTSYVSRVRRWL